MSAPASLFKRLSRLSGCLMTVKTCGLIAGTKEENRKRRNTETAI
jgi:hypothetical protein